MLDRKFRPASALGWVYVVPLSIVLAGLLATSVSNPVLKPNTLIITVGNDGRITMTQGGKPLSCVRLNAMLAADWKDRKPPPSLDCKTGEWKNMPKQ